MGHLPTVCQGQAFLLLPHSRASLHHPQTHPLQKGKSLSEVISGVRAALNSVLLVLRLVQVSSWCKKIPPWQEALLSVSSAPGAHAHQLAEPGAGSMAHGGHWKVQSFGAGSHFTNKYLLASFKARTKGLGPRYIFHFRIDLSHGLLFL